LSKIDIKNYGDSGILISFSEQFSEENWKKTHFLSNKIRNQNLEGILSIIPTLTSLFVHFDLMKIKRKDLIKILEKMLKEINEEEITLKSNYFRIPIVFGGKRGPDLDLIAKEINKSKEDLIKLITEQPNKVLAFSRGPMMGSPVKEKVSRVKSPRSSVPSGTLGIAFNQISISSMNAPSGWKMLGQSPVSLLDTSIKPPGEIRPSDYLSFFSIKENEFEHYKNQPIERVAETHE